MVVGVGEQVGLRIETWDFSVVSSESSIFSSVSCVKMFVSNFSSTLYLVLFFVWKKRYDHVNINKKNGCELFRNINNKN